MLRDPNNQAICQTAVQPSHTTLTPVMSCSGLGYPVASFNPWAQWSQGQGSFFYPIAQIPVATTQQSTLPAENPSSPK